MEEISYRIKIAESNEAKTREINNQIKEKWKEETSQMK